MERNMNTEDAILKFAQRMVDDPGLQFNSKVLSQDALSHLERYEEETKSWMSITPEEVEIGMQLRCVGEARYADTGDLVNWTQHELGAVTEIEHTSDGGIAFGVHDGALKSYVTSFDYSQKYEELYCDDLDKKNAELENEEQTTTLEVNDLIKILSFDGTWSKMKEYVRTQEMSEEEMNRVLYAINPPRDDNSKWEDNWKKIFDDIANRPAYCPDWAELRNDAAKKVEELTKESKRYNDMLRENNKKIKDLKSKPGYEQNQSSINANEKANRELRQRLNMKTKQIAALTLIEAEARSKAEQEKNHVRIKERIPLIESLTQSWKLMLEREKNYSIVMDELKNGYPDKAERKKNKADFNSAKNNVKQFNKEKEKARKIADEIIKKAQKISDKDFRKQKNLNTLEHWSKGTPIDKDIQPIVIRTIEEAQKVIEGSLSASEKDKIQMAEMQRNLADTKMRASGFERAATEDLEKVATNCRARRNSVKEAVQHVVDLSKDGKIAAFDSTMEKLVREADEAFKQTVINRQYMNGSFFDEVAHKGSFQQDLEKFMKDHKFGDILEGHEHDDFDRGR